MKKSKLKGFAKLILKIVVSAGLIIYILKNINQEELVLNLQRMDWRFIPVIITLIFLNYFISSVRWKQLLIHKNGSRVSVWNLTSLYFIGSFFNNFMPTSIGGDVYKVYKLGKKIEDNAFAFTATFTERFSGVLILAAFAVLSFTGFLKYWVLLLIIWFILALYIGFMLMRLLAKKFTFVAKIYETLTVYKNHRTVVIKVIVLAVVVQLISVFTQYAIFLSMGYKIDPFYSLLVFPITTLATFFIPSLNGIGVQDALYMQLLLFVGIPTEVSLAASVLYHLFRLGVSLVGGVLYALGKSD